jgi:hypothetical protein
MNSVASVFGGSDTGEPVAETVLDSASVTTVKRGRGRPRKHVPAPDKVMEIVNPVAQGNLSDILKQVSGDIQHESDSTVSKHYKEYKVVHDSKPDELTVKVNVMLNQGWTLHGGLVINPNGLFVQALYKET